MTADEAGRLYAAMGLHALHPRAATPLLGTLAAQPGGAYVAAEVDWSAFLPVVTARRARPFFAHCAAAREAAPARDTALASAIEVPAAVERLRALPADERDDALRALVAAQVARCLGLAADQIDPEQGFFALGMDSIMVVELVEALRRETGLSLSHASVFEHACVTQLTAHLRERLLGASAPAAASPFAAPVSAPPPDDSAAAELAAEVLALDDQELRALINAEVESVLRGE